jgi:hypothetical protein
LHSAFRRIRREIVAGQYETPERLKVAVDRLWEELERTNREAGSSDGTFQGASLALMREFAALIKDTVDQ